MWYSKVTSNLGNIQGFIEYYEEELRQAKIDIQVKGNVEKVYTDF